MGRTDMQKIKLTGKLRKGSRMSYIGMFNNVLPPKKLPGFLQQVVGYCSAGYSEVIATHEDKEYIYGHCLCGTRWYYRYKKYKRVKKKPTKKKAPKKKPLKTEKGSNKPLRFTMSGVPKCPNHNEPLEIGLSDKSLPKGQARCPVSGAMFAWEANPQGQKKDKFGNVSTEFVVEGND